MQKSNTPELQCSITPAFIRPSKIFMITRHRIYFKSAHQMDALQRESVDLVVTSPPYPMIEMWDALFASQKAEINQALANNDGRNAFELMHRELDAIWQEVWRILKPGGIVCINVGDAARTINGRFSLYPNHARMLSQLLKLGFQSLPVILWRKQTNAPNKFMGSGMLPPGAYVTLEHEYILILRKGSKREFTKQTERQNRRASAFFWEERNRWFSDVWMDIKGAAQHLADHTARQRSAAFPLEVPYRLINMFSVKGDVVVDPFLGIGTTMWAAAASARNCVGYEIETGLRAEIHATTNQLVPFANARINQRLEDHIKYVKQNKSHQEQFKYTNRHYHFPVKTRQETEIFINPLTALQTAGGDAFEVTYSIETAK
jgi:DNA modification methylase